MLRGIEGGFGASSNHLQSSAPQLEHLKTGLGPKVQRYLGPMVYVQMSPLVNGFLSSMSAFAATRKPHAKTILHFGCGGPQPFNSLAVFCVQQHKSPTAPSSFDP